MVYDSSDSGKRDVDSDSGMGSEDIYKGKAKSVLVSLSDLYSKLDSIFVGVSGPSSCPTPHCLLTTFYLLF